MGFDVYGLDPINEDGKYFRNNVWWWRPLWDFITNICDDILSEEDIRSGSFNDGHQIDKRKTLKIVEKLKELVNNGNVKLAETEYKKKQDELPDEICQFCDGTGIRNDEYVKGKCNGCGGTGKVRPTVTWYPFSEENVKDFIKFAENSGGFKIC